MHPIRSWRLVNSILLLGLFTLLGCSSKERPSNLDAKLSQDGTMVAVVRYRPSGAEMRVARLDRRPIQWSRVDIPALTQTFNFGNRNDEILITYGKNHQDKPYTVHLAGVPLNETNRPLREYASSDVFLAFPEQLADGSILVLSGLYRTKTGSVPEKIWQIVTPGNWPRTIGEPFTGFGGEPGVIGTGFYAIEPVYKPAGAGPKLHLWALPGGGVPNVAHLLTQHTSGLACTDHGDLCLRRQTFTNEFQFLGDLTAITNGKDCPLSELPRRIDRVHVAKNARVAAVVVAKDAYAPRKLRILEFARESCEVINDIRTDISLWIEN